MANIDESTMQERPEGVTERQWRAKLVYQAVQAEHADAPEEHVTRANTDAREAARAVLRGEEPAKPKRRRK